MKRLIGIILALLLYTAVLVLPLPAAIGEAARFSRLLIIPIIAIVLYAAYAARGTWQSMLAPCATLVLFALPLAGLWSSGANEQNIIAGLIPYSDASGYYGDALRLLNGGDFLFTRRPLFPAMLTSLLWLSRQDLQVSLAILTALTAMGCYLAARALQHVSGTAATVLLLLLFFYCRRFSGAALTEHLGITLGCLSLALLLQAAHKRSIYLALAGSFFAALALNARAGAFLFLPCLVLWGGWNLGNRRRFSWLASGLIASVILAAFMVNALLFTLLTDTDQPAFSNFSHTLYGLASGGKGWIQVMTDHPEAANNPKTLYRLAYQMILSHPENLLIGILRSWRDFFVPVGQNDLFGFIAGVSDSLVNNGFRVLLWGLTLAALMHLIHQRRNPVNALLLWGLPGIWLSIPFVPPIDADIMRAYAASMPFILALPAIGVKWTLTSLKLQDVWEEDQDHPNEKIALAVGGVVIALSVVLPLLIGIFTSPPQRTNFDCPDGQTAISGYIPRGVTVTLVRDNSNCGRLPAICFADFERQGMPAAPQQFEQLVQMLQSYPGNVALTVIFDQPSKHLFHIMLPVSWLPAPSRPLRLCAPQQPSGLDFYPIAAENLLVQ
ncbi:MAG: hypothetical protein HPY45_11365 [Anaerolineae bacterium]|nr:hypothetical protein [Anaerolineae bacterium]